MRERFCKECRRDRRAFQQQSSIGKTVIRVTFLIMQSITARNEDKDEAFSSHTCPDFISPRPNTQAGPHSVKPPLMSAGSSRSSVNSHKSPRHQDLSNLKLYKVLCYSFQRHISSLILPYFLHWLLQQELKHLYSLTKQGLDHLGEVTPNDTQYREK